MRRHVIDIDLNARRSHQKEPPAPYLGLNVQIRFGNHGISEIELYCPADRVYLKASGNDPLTAPGAGRALKVQPDDFFCSLGDSADLGKVGSQLRQLSTRAGRQRPFHPIFQFGRRQTPVASRDAEDLDGSLSLLMGSPELRRCASFVVSDRRAALIRHVHILQEISSTRNRASTDIG